MAINDDLILAYAIGTWIRNNWGLWVGTGLSKYLILQKTRLN